MKLTRLHLLLILNLLCVSSKPIPRPDISRNWGGWLNEVEESDLNWDEDLLDGEEVDKLMEIGLAEGYLEPDLCRVGSRSMYISCPEYDIQVDDLLSLRDAAMELEEEFNQTLLCSVREQLEAINKSLDDQMLLVLSTQDPDDLAELGWLYFPQAPSKTCISLQDLKAEENRLFWGLTVVFILLVVLLFFVVVFLIRCCSTTPGGVHKKGKATYNIHTQVRDEGSPYDSILVDITPSAPSSAGALEAEEGGDRVSVEDSEGPEEEKGEEEVGGDKAPARDNEEPEEGGVEEAGSSNPSVGGTEVPEDGGVVGERGKTSHCEEPVSPVPPGEEDVAGAEAASLDTADVPAGVEPAPVDHVGGATGNVAAEERAWDAGACGAVGGARSFVRKAPGKIRRPKPVPAPVVKTRSMTGAEPSSCPDTIKRPQRPL